MASAQATGLEPTTPARGRAGWLYLLFLGVVLNLAFPTFRHFDFSHSPDARSYLRLAAGRWAGGSDSIRVTHRYRVLVPLAARAAAAPLDAWAGYPARPPHLADWWTLRFGFYVVNSLLVAAAALLWAQAARATGAAPAAALVAALAVLGSRWAQYAAGLPLTDSLYLLVFALSYYAARRGAGAGWAVAAALLVGPLAKESFLLLLPWLLWFGRRALAWPKQVLALAGGGLALLAVHRYVDAQVGAAATETIGNALVHFADNPAYSLGRALRPAGAAELAGVFGLLWLPVGLAAARPAGRRAVAAGFGGPEIGLLAVVAAHMLLSGDLGRMGFLAAPVFAAVLARALGVVLPEVFAPAPSAQPHSEPKT